VKLRTASFVFAFAGWCAALAAPAPPSALKITRVTPDLPQATLLIEGQNFGSAPAVSLAAPAGAFIALDVLVATPQSIRVKLPTIAPATYLLVVTDGKATTKQDSIAVTIGGTTPNSYMSGVVGTAQLTTCNDQDAISCEEKIHVSVAVPYGSTLTLDLATIKTGGNDEVNDDLTEFFRIEIDRRGARPGCDDGDAIGFKVTKGIDDVEFCLSEANPIYNIKADDISPEVKEHINLEANLAAPWLVVLKVDRELVKEIAPLSDASVIGTEAHDDGRLTVTVKNVGDIRANYITKVIGFSGCALPVSPQWMTLEKYEQREVSFLVRPCDGDTLAGQMAKVVIVAPNGHVYDTANVTF
jgi:hypothetical protein